MQVGWIYLMLNKINGKRYVGQTIQGERRWTKHRSDSFVGSQSAIHRAIRKYGWENFNVSVIWEGPADSLNEQESFFIREHNSLSPHGYNLTTGGQTNGKIISEETKEKISVASLNHWADPEYREKVIATRKQTWSNPELLRKRSEILKKKWEDPEFRENMQAVLQSALDTPEMHELRSVNTKKMWESEEKRNRIIEQMKSTASTPKEKERKSQASKAMWENPEFRKKMAQALRNRWDKQKGIINEQPCS
jgi:group I intron endonuclease